MSPVEPPLGRKKLRVKSEGLWLMSFSDLSFVLLCFFILLLSMSSFDKQRFENVRDGIVGASPHDIKEPVVVKQKNNLKALEAKLLQEIRKANLDAKVVYDLDGLAIEFNEKMLFRSGSAKLAAAYRPLSSKLMTIIAGANKHYKLILEGHTDDVPLGRRAAFRSNWELSSARSISLLNDLKRRGVAPERMSVIAYAHTRPKVPFAGKSGAALLAARKANRRVVVRIQPDTF